MPSADQVPIESPHSTMLGGNWVVLIAGSTGSALRAVRPPNLHITPVVRRDLVYAASAIAAIQLRRSGGMSNRSAVFSIASFSVAASTVPRCSARLRMISTRQRGIYNIAHKKRAIVTNTIEKMMAKIAFPKMVRTHRHTFPVRLSPGGCSFQFGRTSILFPRPPHLAHFTRERNHGTSVSAG